MAIKIEEVIEALQKLKIPGATIAAVESELEQIQEEKKEEKATKKKGKNQFVTILLDPENKLVNLGDFTAIVTQIPSEDDAGTVLSRIYKAAYDYNATKKGRKFPVKGVAEAVGAVKRKQFKEANVAIKSGKETVRVLISDDVIPTETKE